MAFSQTINLVMTDNLKVIGVLVIFLDSMLSILSDLVVV